ncbi:MAG: HAD family phosphatase [Deltaproteobacteria bacterium]|nr:HAD family phosphatase [Deltaproteobacteria bacterium]
MDAFPFAAVLLDLDGVILDSMQQHASAWLEVMAGEGLVADRQFVLENEGCLELSTLERFLAEQGREPRGANAPEAVMSRMLARQLDLYLNQHAAGVRPFAQAAPFLGALAGAGVPTALVTSSRAAMVERCLHQELRTSFRAIITAEHTTRHKPHPEPYLTAARHLAADPRQCLVVENAPAGVRAAKAAGATCYALTTTLTPAHLSEADTVFRDLAELAEHLGLVWETTD